MVGRYPTHYHDFVSLGRPSPARDPRVLIADVPASKRATLAKAPGKDRERKQRRSRMYIVWCTAARYWKKQACEEVENDKFTIDSGRTGPQGPFECLASIQKGRFFGPSAHGSERDRRRNRPGFQRSRRSEREGDRRVRAYPGRGRKGRADQSARQAACRDGIVVRLRRLGEHTHRRSHPPDLRGGTGHRISRKR